MASREGLAGLVSLPSLNQQEVKQLSARVSAWMDICFIEASDQLVKRDKVPADEIWQVWWQVATEALRLGILPKSFEELKRQGVCSESELLALRRGANIPFSGNKLLFITKSGRVAEKPRSKYCSG